MLLVCLFAALLSQLRAQPLPPAAKRLDYSETFHGTSLTDPYHWLEDFDNPETKSWIAAQDQYAVAVLQKLPGQEKLRARMLELSAAERISAPVREGERFFYQRTTPSSSQPLECYRDGIRGPEKVWLDPAEVPNGSGITRLRMGISRDAKLAAYAVRTSGQDEVEIRFREVETGRDLHDTLPKALYSSVSFLPDGSGFFYGVRSRQSGSRIRFHKFGSGNDTDTQIFGEGLDARVFLSARVPRGGRWLLIDASHGWSRTELYVKDLQGNSPVRSLTQGLDAQFGATFCGPDQLLVTTSWKAPRRRALLVNLARPEQAHWREVIPQSDDALQHVTCMGGKLYAHYMHNVQTQIRIYSIAGKPLGEVPLPSGASGALFGDWDQPEAFLSYETLVMPRRVDIFHVDRGKTGVWFESRVPVKPGDFDVKQVWYASNDGARVPMYLVSRKGARPNGTRPVLLTGYGGFNVSLEPTFNPQAILWAEQGAVWARPNLRGGSEFGEEWHRAGMLAKKQNVFDDFISAAEWLIANRYTDPSHLAISGASNGGLLVGAALTQRPDLFAAVYCGYPDLDMVRYYRYTRNNNPPALLEYGDGSNPAHFPFLRSWSPYERVAAGREYPAVLLTTGEGDTRVPPQQAVKMAAKLQWANRSHQPILLRFYRKAGHAGGRGMLEAAADTAAEYAFLMQHVGLKPE